MSKMDQIVREARDFLPLTAAVYHILLALADKDRHGLGIMEDLEERTGKKVLPGPGTLYGTIKRMLQAGLLIEAKRSGSENDDSRRRYYGLTALGRQVMAMETERLASLLRIAAEKHVLRGES